MNFLVLIDLVQQGRERGGLAAAGAAGDENDAGLFLDDVTEQAPG